MYIDIEIRYIHIPLACHSNYRLRVLPPSSPFQSPSPSPLLPKTSPFLSNLLTHLPRPVAVEAVVKSTVTSAIVPRV